MNTKTKAKSLLTFRILSGPLPLFHKTYTYVKLYREDDGLIWRKDNELGEVWGTLNRPKSLSHAKYNVRSIYPPNSELEPFAYWL